VLRGRRLLPATVAPASSRPLRGEFRDPPASATSRRWREGATDQCEGTPRLQPWTGSSAAAAVPGAADAGPTAVSAARFRWFQDLVPETGHTFGIAAGRQIGRLRFELSATQQTHPVALEFIGITYLDGSERAPYVVDSPYASRSTNLVDELTTRSLSVNVYRDFPVPGFRVTPYLGAGLGITYVEVSGLYFHSDYFCREGRSCDPPADRYDTVKSADLTDVVPAAHLFAGVAWHVSDRWALDVKLAYRAVGDLAHQSVYVQHEFPDLTFHEAVRGIRQGSVLLGARYTWADGTTR